MATCRSHRKTVESFYIFYGSRTIVFSKHSSVTGRLSVSVNLRDYLLPLFGDRCFSPFPSLVARAEERKTNREILLLRPAESGVAGGKKAIPRSAGGGGGEGDGTRKTSRQTDLAVYKTVGEGRRGAQRHARTTPDVVVVVVIFRTAREIPGPV